MDHIVTVFLGFLTGAIWLLFAVVGYTTGFFTLIGIVGELAHILVILIAIIGFLAFLIFGFLVFRKAWQHR